MTQLAEPPVAAPPVAAPPVAVPLIPAAPPGCGAANPTPVLSATPIVDTRGSATARLGH